jgi:hypothetical protein
VGVFGSDDRLSFVLKDGDVGEPGMGNSLSNRSSNMRLQALYRNEVSDRVSVSGSAAVGMEGEGTSS